MRIFRGGDAAWTPADRTTFAGAARVKRLASSDAGTPAVVYHVAFEPGARTNWHTHSGPQWLLVIEGAIRVQTWGAPAVDVAAGDAIVIAPGEKHWHGAAPAAGGAHLAVNVNATTDWLEPVGEAEDRGEPES